MANEKKPKKKRAATSKARSKKAKGALTDEELQRVAGGATVIPGAPAGTSGAGGIPDVFQTPAGSGPVPIPYPNVGGSSGSSSNVTIKPPSGEGSGSGDAPAGSEG